MVNRLPRTVLALSFGCGFMLSVFQATAAESNPGIPPVLQSGLAMWARAGVNSVLDAWQKGGALDGDSKITALVNYFKRVDRTVGNYQSWELIESKKIGQSSQIIYLSLNFERGAVYGRFVLYLSDKKWVVQNMDFSMKPEALMPWLSFAGGNYTE